MIQTYNFLRKECKDFFINIENILGRKGASLSQDFKFIKAFLKFLNHKSHKRIFTQAFCKEQKRKLLALFFFELLQELKIAINFCDFCG